MPKQHQINIYPGDQVSIMFVSGGSVEVIASQDENERFRIETETKDDFGRNGILYEKTVAKDDQMSFPSVV